MLFWKDRPAAQRFATVRDPLHEQFVIAILVGQRIARRSAAGLDLLAQADHLIDRLLAVELHHEVAGQSRQLGGRFARSRRGEFLDHHGDHDVGPAFADEAQRSVEVEQGEPRRRGERDFADDLDGRSGQEPRRADFSDVPFVILFVGD